MSDADTETIDFLREKVREYEGLLLLSYAVLSDVTLNNQSSNGSIDKLIKRIESNVELKKEIQG